MKVFMLLTLTAAAFAAPDVSLGYRYRIPSTSYGTPISPADSSLVNPSRQYYHVETRGSLPNTIDPAPPATVFQTPIREYSSFSGGNVGISSAGAIPSGTASFGISRFGPTRTGSSGISTVTGDGITSTGNSAITNSGLSSLDSRGSFQQQQTEVQRHFYYFAAPDEPVEVRPRVNIPSVVPKTNVKIIFIKAPTYSAPAPLQVPVLPQSQEKTLVYVLVKKPEEQAQIDIPTPAPTKPSKPEVYFIKYKTQQDAQEVISNVKNGLAAGGVGANSVEGNQDFINTIGYDAVSNSRDNGVSLTSLAGSLDERIKVGGGAAGSEGGATSVAKIQVGGGTEVSDDGITIVKGRFGDGSVSSVGRSTTASSLEPNNVGSGTAGTLGIQQLYGPPK